MDDCKICKTQWKIVGVEHKILATQHKNSNNLLNTFLRLRNSSNTSQIIPTKNVILAKYKNTLHRSKIGLTKWKKVGAELKILAIKQKFLATRIPLIEYKKVQT